VIVASTCTSQTASPAFGPLGIPVSSLLLELSSEIGLPGSPHERTSETAVCSADDDDTGPGGKEKAMGAGVYPYG
jgi:hypothetical protein